MLRILLTVPVFFVTTYLSMYFLEHRVGDDSRVSAYASRICVFLGFISAVLAMNPAPFSRTAAVYYAFSYVFPPLVSLLVLYTGEPAYGVIAVFYALYVSCENRKKYADDLSLLIPFVLLLATVLLFSDSQLGRAVPDTIRDWYGFDLKDSNWMPSYLTGNDTFFVDEYITGALVFLISLAVLLPSRKKETLEQALDPAANGLENLLRYASERKLVGVK